MNNPELELNLVVVLHPRYLDSRVGEYLRQELMRQYLNKIYKNIIIQDIDLNLKDLTVSTLDMYNNITVRTKISKYMQLKVGDIVSGTVDLTEPQPIFRSDHVKMSIDDTVRQADKILTPYGTKLSQDDKCLGVITKLLLCEGSHFFQGSISLIEPDKPYPESTSVA